MSKEKPRKRINIRGHYMQVRQRSTKKGKKGTVMSKWKPEKKTTRKKKKIVLLVHLFVYWISYI